MGKFNLMLKWMECTLASSHKYLIKYHHSKQMKNRNRLIHQNIVLKMIQPRNNKMKLLQKMNLQLNQSPQNSLVSRWNVRKENKFNRFKLSIKLLLEKEIYPRGDVLVSVQTLDIILKSMKSSSICFRNVPKTQNKQSTIL